MTGDKTINSAWNSITATGSSWVVLCSPSLVNCLKLVNWNILFCEMRFVIKVGGWLACKGSQCFHSITPSNSFVVLIKLSISFLKEWHPPGTLFRFMGGNIDQTITAMTIKLFVRCLRKSVINVDANPSVDNPEFESEHTNTTVGRIRHDACDSRRILCYSRSCGEEPAI